MPTSASCYHVEEYILVVAIVVAILKFRKIERQIFLAHLVVGTDDPAFQHRPKVIQILSVNDTAHVFFGLVIDRFVRVASALQPPELSPFIGRDQVHFLSIDHFANESLGLIGADFFDHLTDQIAFAGDRANDWNLAALTPSVRIALRLVHLAALAADESLIHFDRAEQLSQALILHRGANAHHHVPRRAVITRSDLPMNLKRADSLLALSHQVDHLKPSRERVVGILENRFRDDAETIPIATTAIHVFADPMKRTRRERIHMLALTARAFHAIRPAHIAQQGFARDLIFERPHQFRERDVRLCAERLATFNFGIHMLNIHISGAGVKPNIIAN